MEGTQQSESSPFRISVCLKEFFSDERALCYVSVSGERRVGWLQRRLRRLLPLPAAFCLTVDHHLLPPDERLALLRPDDRLTAKRTNNRECYPESGEDGPEVARENGGGEECGWRGAGTAGAGEADEGEDEEAALREAKRRALADLEACGPPARRARRRARRRRARDDAPPSPTSAVTDDDRPAAD